MKNLFFVACLSLLLLSCASDDDGTGSQSGMEHLLTSKPAWKFESYTVIETYPDESPLLCTDYPSIEIIENRVAQTEANAKFIFNSNGLGIFSRNALNPETFNWEIFENNRLRLIFIESGQSSILENLVVSANQFSFETVWGTIHNMENCYAASHYGKFVYKPM